MRLKFDSIGEYARRYGMPDNVAMPRWLADENGEKNDSLFGVALNVLDMARELISENGEHWHDVVAVLQTDDVLEADDGEDVLAVAAFYGMPVAWQASMDIDLATVPRHTHIGQVAAHLFALAARLDSPNGEHWHTALATLKVAFYG